MCEVASPRIDDALHVIDTLPSDGLNDYFPDMSAQHNRLRRNFLFSVRRRARNFQSMARNLGIQGIGEVIAEIFNENNPRNAHDQQAATIPDPESQRNQRSEDSRNVAQLT